MLRFPQRAEARELLRRTVERVECAPGLILNMGHAVVDCSTRTSLEITSSTVSTARSRALSTLNAAIVTTIEAVTGDKAPWMKPPRFDQHPGHIREL